MEMQDISRCQWSVGPLMLQLLRRQISEDADGRRAEFPLCHNCDHGGSARWAMDVKKDALVRLINHPG